MANKLPFEAIAAAALTRADALVSQWLPDGKREGHEWKALNPMRADGRVGSFSINLTTGAWGDFASDDKGGDLVSLYAYLFTGGDQGNAARELAVKVGIEIPATAPQDRKAERKVEGGAQASIPTDEAPAPKEKKKSSPWIPVLPVPDDAPPRPEAHEFRGMPTHRWRYLDAEGRLLGFICRFTTSDGGKEIAPLHFCRHESTGKLKWNWISAPDPRPLYRLDRLAAKTGATVLLVEGEKCADVGNEHLPEMVSVTWPGGSKAWEKADWSPLAGRKVVLWPDCDAQRDKKTQELLPDEKQPGWKAMAGIAQRLLALGCQVWMLQIPPPGAKPSGWDIADAVAEGFVGTALNEYVTNNLVRVEPEPDPDARAAERHPNAPRATAGEGKEFIPDLIWTKNGLAACLANVYQIITHSKAWRGVIAFDEFSQRTVKLKPPPFAGGAVGEWDSTDDSRTAIMLSQRWDFSPSSATVAEAVEVIGRANAVHPVRQWLESLPAWDGQHRLTEWLSDCLGVPKTEYSMRVGTWFLQGMVERVMNPGCKFDYCLVLEGPQGRGKSTALKVLGGEWYGDTDLDLHNKDSMSALRGKWLYEFPELGSVTRVEERKQKSFLSRNVDEYRPVYGRREIKAPRQLVFAGTTNEWEWNKDPTGGRRFWPVECGEINLEALAAMRDQLFAEALHRHRRGKRFWPTPEEQANLFDKEQLKVEIQDSLVDQLHDWVYEQKVSFSLATALTDGLGVRDASKHTKDLQQRVGTALRKLGCTKKEHRNGMVRFVYEPPERKGALSTATRPAQQDQDEDYVGF